MAKTTYTPGKWHTENNTGVSVAIKSGKNAICSLTFRGGQYELALANAALISAAPDMHEALDDFPDLHDGRMSETELLEAAREWYAAKAVPAKIKATRKLGG